MDYTICYVSSEKDKDITNLTNLFSTTLANNNKKDITGILLYLEGTFLQVLEGNQEDLKTLFDKIKQDVRHKDIFVIINKGIDQRIFDQYKSGFDTIESKEDLLKLQQYLTNYKKDLDSSKSILGILEPFLL